MRDNPEYLLSLCYGPTVLSACATRWACSEAAVRIAGLMGSRYVVGHQIGLKTLAGLVGMHYHTCQRTVKELRRLGWIEARNQRNQVCRLTIEGLRIASLIERAEREIRVKVQRAELPKWPRKYTRRTVGEKTL